MIPISDELKSAVLHEVTPKRLTVRQDNSAFEKLNWFSKERQGYTDYTVTSSNPTISRNEWNSYGDDDKVVNDYFGRVKYVYFTIELCTSYGNTPSGQTASVECSFDLGMGEPTSSVYPMINNVAQVMNYTDDGKVHKVGIKLDGFYANNVFGADDARFIFSNFSSDIHVRFGYPQVFLSDTDYDNFDDIHYCNTYATKENIDKYIPQKMPFSVEQKTISDFNWLKKCTTYNTNDTITLPARGNDYWGSGFWFSMDGRFDHIGEATKIRVAFRLNARSETPNTVFHFRQYLNCRKIGTNITHVFYVDSATYNARDAEDVFYDFGYTANIEFTSSNEQWEVTSLQYVKIFNDTDSEVTITTRMKDVHILQYVDTITDPYKDRPIATDRNVDLFLVKNPVTDISNENIISETFNFNESICSAEIFKLGGCETSSIELDVFNVPIDLVGTSLNFDLQIADIEDKFKWGKYTVREARKTARGDIICRHLLAYDDMQKLESNAYAWYTQYMWGINLEGREGYHNYSFDYPRQIFSTYWNLARSFGIESDDNLDMNKIMNYAQNSSNIYNLLIETNKYLRYGYKYFYRSDLEGYSAFYIVGHFNDNYKDGVQYKNFLNKYDSLGRGVDSANVLLEFTIDGEQGTVNYLCDFGDIIIPPKNWTEVLVLTPDYFYNGSIETVGMWQEIYGVNFKYYDPNNIVNASQALPYFSYVWRKPTTENIFKADSSITARDVMRSLMEMCGCFFRLDREGHPQFLYAMEHGLYPSNTLFPADDLFPRKSSELTMPTSYYIKANFEEYRVSNFGGVQVVVNTYDSQGAVVRWEYWGDETLDNAYLIDDNIFLCNSQFEYEPEMAGNVQELLENLWNVLNNMSYTPFTAETIGTPFLESGDRFTLLTKTDGFESFIFERTLKGIQVLKDYYEARGVAKTPRVKNFEWGNTNE